MSAPLAVQDFAEQLEDQLSFLQRSSERFDAGAENEAKRLAVSLRVLLHSAGRSVALLDHLGVRDRLPWTDSADGPLPPGVIGALNGGLCTVRILPPPVSYIPPLEQGVAYNPQPPHCFDDWWNTTVLSDERRHNFSRRDLVLSVANQDGGAHVDAKLDASYAALTRENSLQHTWGRGDDGTAFLGFTKGAGPVDGDPLLGSIALAHIRQITWEAMDTFTRHLIREENVAPYVRAPICPAPFSADLRAGRNDSCPCGSGRKFKHCFSRRQARRPEPLPA